MEFLASESGGTAGGPVGKRGEGLSELLARILDQLSISSWLPAGVLVAAILLYGNVAADGGSVRGAMQVVASLKAGEIALLLAGVVLTTVLTQAFEFGAIRLLEGYWGTNLLGSALGEVGCRLHCRRISQLEQRRKTLKERAVAETTVELAASPPEFTQAIHASMLGQSLDHFHSTVAGDAIAAGWRVYASPRTVRELAAVDSRLELYPAYRHDVMPTRLGNVLRSFEERVEDPGEGALEGMVQRLYSRLPPSLQAEHDQFRGRLDLYCSLTFLTVMSGIAGAAVLGPTGLTPAIVGVGCNVVLAWVFYRGAVASAAGYGQVLVSVRDVITQAGDTQANGAATA